jgi:hypothetical protein
VASLAQEALNLLYYLLLIVELLANQRYPKSPPLGMGPLMPLQSFVPPKRTSILIYSAVVEWHSDSRARLSSRDDRVIIDLLILRRHLKLA